MLPAETPKLPKWPFLLTDAALLGLAWYVASQHKSALTGTPLIVILVCIVCGTILAAFPFLSDYARKQDEALDERQRGLEGLSRVVAASAEQISIAANGLHELTELAQRNFKAAEQIAPKLQEKIAALKTDVGALRDEENQKLRKELAAAQAAHAAKLEAAADRIVAAVAEFSRVQSSAPIPPADAAAAIPGSVPPVAIAAEPPPIPAAAIPEIAPVAPSDSASPMPPRKRAPRKPKPATPQPAETAPVPSPAAEIPSEIEVDEKPAVRVVADEPSPPPAKPRSKPAAAPVEPALNLEIQTPIQQAEVVERVRSSDGATRLLVTAYIGIGNRLFIRGEGPGLSWSKGVPLQFVSIGKWRWDTPEAEKAVKFKLYKNDDIECTALGAQSIDPGQQEEVVATF